MVDSNGVDLAPFYDLLSVQAWLPDSTLAMSIYGENRPGWIESGHWRALAAEAGVPVSLMRSYLQRINDRMGAVVDKLLGDNSFVAAERDFIAQNVIPVIRERGGYVQAVLMDASFR